MTYIDPTREAFDAFKALPRDTPIHMLNLIRYRQAAEYPEGHDCADKGWSGARAYREYGRLLVDFLKPLGAQIVWSGGFENMLTGPADQVWDDGFVMAYPDAKAFLTMIVHPEYKKIVIHRTAALADSRLMRFRPRRLGEAEE